MIPKDYRLLYVPALSGGIEHHVISKRRILGQKHLWKNKFDGSFWTDHALFKWPYLLTSAFYSKKIPNWRKSRLVGDRCFLMADSGGFSVATKGAKLNALEVYKWQEKNSDACFTLDHPPVNVKKSNNQVSSLTLEWMNDYDFNKALDTTCYNNEIFAENRTRKDDFWIFNCLHGPTEERYNTWFNRVKDFPFDGWATGSKPAGDVLLQALSLARLYRDGLTDRIHLLGVGGRNVIPMLVYATKYFTRLSCDSSSWCQGYFIKKYLVPPHLDSNISFGRNSEMFEEFNSNYKFESDTEKYYRGLDKLPCNCPVCIEVDHPDILAQRGSIGGALIALHNLYAITQWINSLLDMSFDELKAYIAEKCPSRTMDAIKFIDCVVDRGYDFAFDSYRHKFTEEVVGQSQFTMGI